MMTWRHWLLVVVVVVLGAPPSTVVQAWKLPPAAWYRFEEQFSEQRSAKEKFHDVWTMLTTTGRDNPPYATLLDFLKWNNFLAPIPRMTLGRIRELSLFRPWRTDRKVLHTRPAYAWIRWNLTDAARHKYTGVFEADALPYGLMTYSAGYVFPNLTNFFASSMRLFRDHAPAAAVIAAFNLVSLANWNIFDYLLCTHLNWLMALPLTLLGPLPPGEGWTLFFNQFGLSNLAEHTVHGDPVASPRFPWALCFVPHDTVRQRLNMPTRIAHDPIDLVRDVRPGDILYSIWAIQEPYPLVRPASLRQYSECIGTVEAVSEFFTSTYGAQRLFGPHQRFEDDLKYRPDWLPYATPRYLARAGAVGVYGGLFPRPKTQLVALERNLLVVMTGFFKALAAHTALRNAIVFSGVSPAQVVKSVTEYMFTEFPRQHVSSSSSSSSSLRSASFITPRWIANTIANVALYVRQVGWLPPLAPSHVGRLGAYRAANETMLAGLLHTARQSVGRDDCRRQPHCRQVEDDQTTNATVSAKAVFQHVPVLPFSVHAFVSRLRSSSR